MFSAMPKAKAKKGAAARPVLVRRSARSVRAPARLAEEAPAEPIASDDDSSNASADDGLRQQIAELQAQLRKASARPDAATASTSASDADVTALPSMSAGLLLRSLPPAATPVEPTPLLPPAPPSSQDLLASILQQMTTPATTAGEHDGASGGGIAQSFVLGATLDPKVKAKIREGSYVDTISSPPARLHLRVDLAVRRICERIRRTPPSRIPTTLQLHGKRHGPASAARRRCVASI